MNNTKNNRSKEQKHVVSKDTEFGYEGYERPYAKTQSDLEECGGCTKEHYNEFADDMDAHMSKHSKKKRNN